MLLEDLLEKYQKGSVKTASEVTPVAPISTEVEKTAYEQGADEAQNMVKVAAALGDIIGGRIADVVEQRLAESFGYDSSVLKTASMQDVMYDSLCKIAEQVSGNTAQKAVSDQLAEEQQIGEAAAHHANLAAASATDAIQSLNAGDEHTATQMLATAGNAIEVAKNFASRVPGNAAVAQHVNEAAAVVSQAANDAAAHVQGQA